MREGTERVEPADPGQRVERGTAAAAERSGRRGLIAIGVALAGTLLLGAWLRWGLTGRLPLVGDFANLRHAHSHLGYYGVLFPLAWAGWRQAGAETPGPRVLAVYAAATALAFVGFLRAGYGIEAIVGSTVAGIVWLATGWRLRGRVAAWSDPLAPVLPGIVGAMACVPFVAMTLRSDPATAQALVATFLGALLLAVMVPSAFAARGVAVPGAPLLTLAALLGACSLGIWPAWPARIGLAGYGLWLVTAFGRRSLPLHLRLVWGLVGVGLVGMAAGLLPNVRPVVIGAIHFLVLSPVLGSLAAARLPRPLAPGAWWFNHAFVALLAAPLAAQGFGAGAWTMTLSAIGGTGVVLWWSYAAWAQVAGVTRA